MSINRLLTAIIVGLLATSLGSSLAAFHLYQLGLERFAQVSDLDDEIGVLGMDLFRGDDLALNIDSIVGQLLGPNSTGEQPG